MIRKRKLGPATYRVEVVYIDAPPRIFLVTSGQRGRGGWHIHEYGKEVGPGFRTFALALDYITTTYGDEEDT